MLGRVLVLSASVGAGHVHAAQAVKRAFLDANAARDVRHIDTLEYTNKLFRRLTVCGRSRQLKNSSDRPAARIPQNHPVCAKVVGYTDKMDEPMAASVRKLARPNAARDIVAHVLALHDGKPAACRCEKANNRKADGRRQGPWASIAPTIRKSRSQCRSEVISGS